MICQVFNLPQSLSLNRVSQLNPKHPSIHVYIYTAQSTHYFCLYKICLIFHKRKKKVCDCVLHKPTSVTHVLVTYVEVATHLDLAKRIQELVMAVGKHVQLVAGVALRLLLGLRQAGLIPGCQLNVYLHILDTMARHRLLMRLL